MFIICNGIILLVFQVLFKIKIPTVTPKANKSLKSIGKSLGDGNFTCIRIFGSYAHPHVLPLYILEKLLAKEIAYQTIGNGLTKILKDAKRTVWPTFPFPVVRMP